MLIRTAGCGLLVAVLLTGCSGDPEPAGQAPTPSTADPSGPPTTPTTSASTPIPTAGPALAQRVPYAERRFRSSGRPLEFETWLEAPKDWSFRSTGYAKAESAAGPWQLDIEVFPGAANTQAFDLSTRLKRLLGSPGLRVISKTPGVLRFEDGVRDYTTLTYTYTSSSGTRLVMSRWLELTGIDGQRISHAELTVSGRPQDSAGLQAVLMRATNTLTVDE